MKEAERPGRDQWSSADFAATADEYFPDEAPPERDDPVAQVSVHDLFQGDSPRIDGVNADHVRALAEVETSLPPILVHRRTMRVVDGMHRVHAAKLKGVDKVDVLFVDGPLRDLFPLAVRANVEHGLPLTPADRRAAAARIVRTHPYLSDRAIAASTGLAAKTVSALRQQVGDDASAGRIRVGRDGRRRPLDATAGRRTASKLIADKPGASLREIAREAGISVGTVRDVRARVGRGEDPVPPARRAGDLCPPTMPQGGYAGVLTDPVDFDAALRRLRSDPALRYSESGRTLLRWLTAYAAIIRARQTIDIVPPHCADLVANFVRRGAQVWEEFADELAGLSTVGRPVS